MTEQEMWEAVKHSDASYDGLFFYAVKRRASFAAHPVALSCPSGSMSATLPRRNRPERRDFARASAAAATCWNTSPCVTLRGR